jgi:hypothetical protein
MPTQGKADSGALELVITLAIVAAGVVTVALLIEWTLQKYVILAPAPPASPPDRAPAPAPPPPETELEDTDGDN